ncbi:MAG: phenylalanine--tRNA ligase subunit beta [Candidatus Diapherotrites archaeon]
MPTVEVEKKDLEKLIGKKFSKQELEDALMYVKGEVDAWEGDLLKVDMKDTNRPDLWSTEGIARELKGRLGIRKGMPEYKVKKSGISAEVDPALKNIRPKAAYAIARGVKVTDEFIRQIVQLQEKICMTFGRKRDEVAIGLFDLDQVHGNVKYYAAKKSEEFIPLDYGVKMRLDEILQEHPKGKEYGHLIAKFDKFPLLVDSKGEVLSMPPIINSAGSGKITEKTRNLFVDVTGFDQEKINTALKIICMALADRGGKIESVEIKYNGKKLTTPEFGTKKISVDLDFARKMSGIDFTSRHFLSLIQKSGMVGKLKGKKVEVTYADYRRDIIHAVDVIEDVLISEGFNSIKPEKVEMDVVGHERVESIYLDKVRDVCVGLGLQEILTFVLSSRERQERKIGLKGEKFVELANPVSLNWVIMRKRLYPEHLGFLFRNKNADYPQRIFEIGRALELGPKNETGVKEMEKLCIVVSDRRFGFTQMKSVLDAVCSNLGINYSISDSSDPAFEKGKSGEISMGKKRGVLGEINRKTLDAFGLEMPVSVMEIEI